MTYRVKEDFFDLQDRTEIAGKTVYHSYRAGDIYPRKGNEPSAERIAELLGKDNRRGVALIEEVKEPKKKTSSKK